MKNHVTNFSGLKEIALLETLGDAEKNKEETEKLGTALKVLEKSHQLNLKQLLSEIIERNKQKTEKTLHIRFIKTI